MSDPRMSMIRTCIERAIGCLNGDNVASTRVELAAPRLGFALQLDFVLKAQTFTATFGTSAGIGAVDTFDNVDPAQLVATVCGEVQAALSETDLTGLSAVLSAQPVNPEQFLPVGKMVDSAPDQVYCMSDDMAAFLRAAIERTVNEAAGSGSCSLRVTTPGMLWPVWICVDVAGGSYSASTNDIELMVPCPPSFYTQQQTAAAIVARALQFLAEEFVDAPTTSILIRRAGVQPNLTGDSAGGPDSIVEEVIADI